MRIFVMMLTVLFIALKLTAYIVWSWWLVLSPLLAWVAWVFVLYACLGVVAILAANKGGFGK